MLERWTRAVIRHRLAVVALWLAVLGAGVWASSQLPSLLANPFDVPGTESDRARELLARHFDERPDGTFVVVFEVDQPSRERAVLARRVREAAAAVPGGRLGRSGTGGGVVWAEVRTPLELEKAKQHTDALRGALRDQAGPRPLVTGQPAIQRDLDPVLAADLVRGRAIALPVALLALVLVLGVSVVVLFPFLVAACAISATLAAVYVLAHALPMVSYVTNVVELIGIALAIDYSLLVVHRFREELRRGGRVDDAVVRTIGTAGRTVAFSGVAVAIGLCLMLLIPVPLLRSLGVAGVLIALLSVAAALTLQPALLSLAGRRALRGRGGLSDRGVWARLARGIMRRPHMVAAAGLALLLVLALPVRSLELIPGSFDGLPDEPEAMRGLSLFDERVGAGVITPTHLIIDSGTAGGMRDPRVRDATDLLAAELATDPEANVVARGRRPPYVDPTRRYARVVIAARHDWGDAETRLLVERLRERHVPSAGFPEWARTFAGGAPPQGLDFLDRIYAWFPWLVAAVLLLTYLVLLRAFRSLLLPLKAVALNVLSVTAVYGILTLAYGEVEGWIPVFLFAVLFGLSMDYEVFVVSRIREAWDESHDTRAAIAAGLERTGRIVTAAAVIMVAAFSGFYLGSVESLRQFGLGLALGVLIDATIVRLLLVPALMTLLGRWNWWLPARLARLMRVEPSPLLDRA